MTPGERLTEERVRIGAGVGALASACNVSAEAQRLFERDKNVPGGSYLIAAAAQHVDVKYVLTGKRGIERVIAPLDVALLRDCIEGVERGLKAMQRTLAVGPKCALIAECYDEFRERGGATRANVLEFIQRAA